MKYQLSFGQLPPGQPAASGQDARFRIAILADLSGRASRGELRTGEALAKEKGRKVDVDNFEDRLQQAELKLQLDVGAEDGNVEIPITSLDDFHPDELYDNLDFFSELSGLRRQLGNSSTFDSAAAQVQGWAGQTPMATAPRRSAAGQVPRGKLSDFAELIGRTDDTPREEASAEALIRSVVAPFVEPEADPRQDEFVAAVDNALAEAMRRILHHPDFQAAESTWRSIDLLTRRLETSPALEIVLFDISAEELAADLSASEDLTSSGLYQLLVVEPTLDAQAGPFSVIVGNYQFEHTPPHADLLARCAQIATAARAPLLTGVSISSLEQQLTSRHPLCDSAWEALQAMPEAVYLGLVAPRFLLRWPYGKKTEPIDPFDFEEFNERTGLRGMLWGNGAMLAGLLLGQTFAQSERISQMSVGDLLGVDDLPYYYYTDKHGDQMALPCGERLMPEAEAMKLSEVGCMPLLSVKNAPEVRLGGLRSVQGDPLAGPWAPVDVAVTPRTSEPAAPAPEPAAPAAEAPAPTAPEPTAPAEPEPTAPAEPEPTPEAEQSSATAEQSSATAEQSSATAEQSSATESGDDELDALLASLDDVDDGGDSGDDDMDPELAKLLEGL